MIQIEGIGEVQRRLKSPVERLGEFDWQQIGRNLDRQGNAVMQRLLSPEQCRSIAGLYSNDDLFRSHVVMGRHGFGRGEYKCFSYPLPDLLDRLRTGVYPHLVGVANRWNEAMGIDTRYPDTHADFIERCHNAGQKRSTPLLLQYGVDDYNCLHQDLYDEHVFPIQLAILLAEYIRYYHIDRTHLGLEKDAPVPRMRAEHKPGSRIRSLPRLGGLHHRYEPAA
jgi:hypothetical protein